MYEKDDITNNEHKVYEHLYVFYEKNNLVIDILFEYYQNIQIMQLKIYYNKPKTMM